MAERYWPDEDPMGKCLYIRPASDAPCHQVVGVLEDVRRGYADHDRFNYYLPIDLDPRLRSVEVTPLRKALSPEARPWRLGATLFGLFGVLALVVAAVGLYSVLTYGVAQRTFELGIRSAIGASWRRLIASVVGQGLVMVGIGATVGLIIAVAISPRLEGLLFQVSPRDPGTIAVVVLVLCAAAVLACIAPALRATRIDPATALRSE